MMQAFLHLMDIMPFAPMVTIGLVLGITQPADRLLEGQTRRANPHRAVLKLVEASGEAAKRNGIVPPLTAALHIPARLHRREMPLAPVAPLPQAVVG